jgi:Protein of unknown function (DUF2809)
LHTFILNLNIYVHQFLTLNKKYLYLSIILFALEIIIAKYIHDDFIRPYIGDLLVVVLIYCFLKSFLNVHYLKMAIAVLIFSYCIEALQFIKLVNIVGLQNYKWARIIIGTSFSWIDMLMYTIGIIIVIVVEKKLSNQ